MLLEVNQFFYANVLLWSMNRIQPFGSKENNMCFACCYSETPAAEEDRLLFPNTDTHCHFSRCLLLSSLVKREIQPFTIRLQVLSQTFVDWL